jgi:hypothetical protein
MRLSHGAALLQLSLTGECRRTRTGKHILLLPSQQVYLPSPTTRLVISILSCDTAADSLDPHSGANVGGLLLLSDPRRRGHGRTDVRAIPPSFHSIGSVPLLPGDKEDSVAFAGRAGITI